ncbi:MAG: hypothetical protein GC181_00940 [Bacteroidetes bacterium]|nr:hypothetical protein [Bacteroidota bacterium]
MKKLLTITVSFVALVLILQNCKHELPVRKTDDVQTGDTTQHNTDTTGNQLSDTCSPDTVYFVSDVLPIILSNCAQPGCHDANSRMEGIVLTDYNNIIKTGRVIAFNPAASKIYQYMVTTNKNKIMPPPPLYMTPEQINAIKIWIEQGALNNSCQNRCDTSVVSYKTHIWPILETTCKGCHNGSSGNGGISITNYTEVKTLVDNGKLDGTINHRSGYQPMPPLPGQVEDCAKSKIAVWIRGGAKNN